MINCRNCGGAIYEEESYYDLYYERTIQLGCRQCSKKVQVNEKDWNDFKDKLAKAKKRAR